MDNLQMSNWISKRRYQALILTFIFLAEQFILKYFKNQIAPSITACTISGFNNVEVSPKFEVSFEAIFLKIRRIILPERVLGRPGTIWILSGFAIGPISFVTVPRIPFTNSSADVLPSVMTYAYL